MKKPNHNARETDSIHQEDSVPLLYAGYNPPAKGEGVQIPISHHSQRKTCGDTPSQQQDCQGAHPEDSKVSKENDLTYADIQLENKIKDLWKKIKDTEQWIFELSLKEITAPMHIAKRRRLLEEVKALIKKRRQR